MSSPPLVHGQYPCVPQIAGASAIPLPQACSDASLQERQEATIECLKEVVGWAGAAVSEVEQSIEKLVRLRQLVLKGPINLDELERRVEASERVARLRLTKASRHITRLVEAVDPSGPLGERHRWARQWLETLEGRLHELQAALQGEPGSPAVVDDDAEARPLEIRPDRPRFTDEAVRRFAGIKAGSGG